MEKKTKRTKKKYYWTPDTEAAVIEYIAADKKVVRDRVYNTRLHKPLMKLTEILINSGSYPYALQAAEPEGNARERFKTLQHLTICHVLNILHNFNPDNGKAYSYFTVVINFYLINENKKEYRKIKEKKDIESLEYLKEEIGLSYLLEQEDEFKDFVENFETYFDANIYYYFPKQRDFAIANAFLEILKRRDVVPDFQKKKVYLLIREQTNCRQPDITSVFNKIKTIGEISYCEYFRHGFIDINKIFKLEPSKGKKKNERTF